MDFILFAQYNFILDQVRIEKNANTEEPEYWIPLATSGSQLIIDSNQETHVCIRFSGYNWPLETEKKKKNGLDGAIPPYAKLKASNIHGWNFFYILLLWILQPDLKKLQIVNNFNDPLKATCEKNT